MKLDDYYKFLSTTDTKKKLSVGQEIIDYLEVEGNELDCDDIGSFIDGLVPWMQSSNFKVSQNGLDITALIVSRLDGSFKPYLNTVLGAVIDRLGDSRETVREKALHVINLLMDRVVEPQALLEKMLGAFSHKNSKVREEMLILFQSCLNSYGAHSLTVSRFLPSIVNLVSDPTASVRNVAQTTIIEVYRHVGERVRMDLQKKYQLPPAKLNQLLSKFDEIRASGDMMPTAAHGVGTMDENRGGDDETDRISHKSSGGSAKSRSSSVPAHARKPASGAFAMPRPPTTDTNTRPTGTSLRRNHSMRGPSSAAGGQAGAVDEESFIAAFEEVKRVTIFSARGLSDEITKIRDTLSKSSNDWKVRIEALQMLRSLLVAGAANYDELYTAMRTLDVPFQTSVKDLRSQVVREACITIAYFSQQLRNKVDRFLETLLQNLINLIPNSAKVMSTSGIVCIRFIIQNTFSARFLPILTSNLSSRSKEIRRHCCEFLDQLLHTWPTHCLEKHVTILGDAIKKGIADADPDARQFARKAYWGYADHFKDQADHLLSSLDSQHRRLLQAGEMSNSSSSNSLHRASGSTLPRSRQASVTGSREELNSRRGGTPSGTMTMGRKSSGGGSGIPMYSSPMKSSVISPFNGFQRSPSGYATPGASPSPSSGMSARSNSAIDPSAVRRASVRAQYAQRNRIQVANSTVRSRKSSIGDGMSPVPGAVVGTQRSRSRVGVVHSQPGSRSASPSSLRSYHTYNYDASPMGSATLGGRRRSSGIPRSTNSSREQSPSRIQGHYGPSFYNRRSSGTQGGSGLPPKRPLMTESILRQSREAENALADALSYDYKSRHEALMAAFPSDHYNFGLYNKGPRGRNGASAGPFDDGASDDGSEASSISSTGNTVGFGHSGPTPMKPRPHLQSPNNPFPRRISGGRRPPFSKGVDPADAENLNPEDVHKSLRSTANAIQNYSFDAANSPGAKLNDLLDGSRGKNSPNVTSLEDKISLLDISSPTAGGTPVTHKSFGANNGAQSPSVQIRNHENSSRMDDTEVIDDIMETLQTVKTQSQSSERRNCMTKLIRMSREGKTEMILDNFKAILRLLLENLADEVGATRALVFGVLTEMMKSDSLNPAFQAFTELIILKVLEAHKDDEKDVERAAESCAGAMASVLPSDLVIRVLNPIIKTGDYPVNQAAIKMLTKVADHSDNTEVILMHLPEIMPGLLKSYDNVESSVRKASVFCMVALHQMVGEELQPHLESLNGSKLKLLNLYIKRAQTQKEQSAPVSPRQLATPF